MTRLRTELEAFFTKTWPPMPPRLLRSRIQTLPSLPAWRISADGFEPALHAGISGTLLMHCWICASRAYRGDAADAQACQREN